MNLLKTRITNGGFQKEPRLNPLNPDKRKEEKERLDDPEVLERDDMDEQYPDEQAKFSSPKKPGGKEYPQGDEKEKEYPEDDVQPETFDRPSEKENSPEYGNGKRAK